MGSIYKRGETFWLSYYRNGKRIRESADTSKKREAQEQLRIREGDIARGVPITPRINKLKFKELADDMIIDFEANGRKSLRSLKGRLNGHILPHFGHRLVSSITTADLRRFIALRQKAGASNAEINRELAHTKRAFNLGRQAGLVHTVPHFPMLKESNVRTGFFERDQFESVRRFMPEVLRTLISFFFVTGWRLGEVLKLEWSQVDFEARRVVLDPGTTKNGEGRIFPFTDELAELLLVQRDYTDRVQKKQGRIIPCVFHRNGKRIKDFRGAWDTACKRAGLPGKLVHDFRRTAVRNLVRAGVPERVAMKLSGHQTRSVFERYNIVNESDLETAARKLNDFHGHSLDTNLRKMSTQR